MKKLQDVDLLPQVKMDILSEKDTIFTGNPIVFVRYIFIDLTT